MTGEHTINVWNRRVRYSLRVRRNITILTGDSGTGKSKMIKLIEDYDDSKELSGVHLECDKRCVHLQGRYWKYLLTLKAVLCRHRFQCILTVGGYEEQNPFTMNTVI